MFNQIVLVLMCYLIGAIPFGFLVVRFLINRDVRDYGSGNIGMTNVLRTTGIKSGILVLMLDTGKGLMPVFVVRTLFSDPYIETFAAIAVLVGHIWPVFLKFNGGKGVATGIGTFCYISPFCGLIAVSVGCITLLFTRYVSLGSVLGVIAALIAILIMGIFYSETQFGISSSVYIAYPLIGVPIILFRHRENIVRLINGQERKLGRS
jgi:glycerol-3-phosphate acyltransferase PlsY